MAGQTPNAGRPESPIVRGLAWLLLILGGIVVVAVAAVALPWPVGLLAITGTGMVGAGAAMFKRHGGTSA